MFVASHYPIFLSACVHVCVCACVRVCVCACVRVCVCVCVDILSIITLLKVCLVQRYIQHYIWHYNDNDMFVKNKKK